MKTKRSFSQKDKSGVFPEILGTLNNSGVDFTFKGGDQNGHKQFIRSGFSQFIVVHQ